MIRNPKSKCCHLYLESEHVCKIYVMCLSVKKKDKEREEKKSNDRKSKITIYNINSNLRKQEICKAIE